MRKMRRRKREWRPSAERKTASRAHRSMMPTNSEKDEEESNVKNQRKERQRNTKRHEMMMRRMEEWRRSAERMRMKRAKREHLSMMTGNSDKNEDGGKDKERQVKSQTERSS